MKATSDRVEEVMKSFRQLATAGFSEKQTIDAEVAFKPWILAKLAQYNPELYSEDEYTSQVIPGEISYLFQGLDRAQRYEKAVTADDTLTIQILNEKTYERARLFFQKEGDLAEQKKGAETDLKKLKEIESRLSKEYPQVYRPLKKQISESKLDCLYVIRDGGASSLRLGREIQRSGQR